MATEIMPTPSTHATLARAGQTVFAMMTHSMRIRRQLRSARVSALTVEERREALLAAEKAREQHGDRPEPDADAGRGTTPTPRSGAS